MRARIPAEGGRGILHPHAIDGRFTLARHAPASDLADLVDRHWTIRWDLRERGPFAQETLPFPQINLVFGTHRPGLHGVGTRRFVAEIEGEGWVVGTKFRPGGFRPLWNASVRELTGRSVAIAEAFGEEGAALDAAVHAARTEAERIALVEAFLRARRRGLDEGRGLDEDGALAARAVALAQADPSITRVADLAARVGVTVRKLQRVFGSHVGVSPLWVIRRFRVQEAAERVARGDVTDWSSLAHELGYFDQAHFIREFKAQVGHTPGAYAARCLEATR